MMLIMFSWLSFKVLYKRRACTWKQIHAHVKVSIVNRE